MTDEYDKVASAVVPVMVSCWKHRKYKAAWMALKLYIWFRYKQLKGKIEQCNHQ